MGTQTTIEGIGTIEGDEGTDANLEEMAEAVEQQLREPSPPPESSNDRGLETPTFPTSLRQFNGLALGVVASAERPTRSLSFPKRIYEQNWTISFPVFNNPAHK